MKIGVGFLLALLYKNLIKEKQKGKEMQLDSTKYFIEKEVIGNGVITFTCTEKERKCEYCKRWNSTKKMELLTYRDSNGYRRIKELCLYCYKELKQYI